MKKFDRTPGERGFLAALGLFSLVCLAGAANSFAGAPRLSGQGTVPLLCSLVMVLLSGACLLKTGRGGHGVKETLAFLFPGKVGPVLACCLMYGLMLGPVGFLPSTAVFLALTMVLLEPGKKMRAVVTALLVPLAVLVVFKYLFQVQLP